MKTARLQLWISSGEDRGQRSRPCICEYTVNPVGSSCLYGITKITDARTGEEYPLTETLSINEPLDERIAAASPTMREFAARELNTVLGAKKPAKKVVQKPAAKPTTIDEDLFL